MNKKTIIILSVIIILGATCYFEGGRISALLYPRKYSVYVEQYAKQYNLDENLVYSVIKAESKFNQKALSRRGAKGLMQIADITKNWAIEELDLSKDIDIYDPETNIMIGCWYLNTLYKEFGETDLVIAAYNGGSGNVKKWLSDKEYSKDGEKLHMIPFSETDRYLVKVNKNYKKYNELYGKEGKN
ncbi:MAG: lytic transglycosylase domain-containing protein [Terrisporobacter sp.]|uniref:lytic transglycosylase domain-containing protein n=1 Tax=Terrisporobacter sp. TaxID=1965305 RepID=UPI002FCC7347